MSKENKLDNRAGKTLFPPPVKPYKEYQVQIIKDVIDAILNGLNGLVIQPTATGKSTEAAFIARSCILLHGMRGIYLYDENDGLHQARKSFEYIFSKNKVKCANFFGNEKDDDVTESDIVFASFQAMNNHHEKWYKMFNKDHFDFMLVNEAHHGQAVTYKTVIEHFSCPHIGFTGTPERMDGLNILEVFDRVLAEITLVEAIVKGWVSQVEYHVLGHNLSSKKLKELVRDYTEEGKKISIKQLNESIFIDELDTEMMKKVYEYAFPEKEAKRQTKIFCENIEHANRVVAQIKKDGHNAEVAHSKMTMNHNTNALESFRRSEIQFLVSVDKYNEDIDIPNIEVVVFFRTTDSKTVFFQQLGRGLRRGKPKLYVLDFVGNTARMLILGELESEIRKYTENGTVFDKHKINIGSLGFKLKWHGYSPDVLKLIQAINVGKYSTCKQASEAVVKLGFKTKSDYQFNYKKDPLLPSNPSKQYGSDFPGWVTFITGKVHIFAPDGWITPNKLQESCVAASETIKNYADEFRENHPEWFSKYLNKVGKLNEYYHPDLVKLILLKFKREGVDPPKGWLMVTEIHVGKLGSPTTIKKYADGFRKSNPEWFGLFWKLNGFYQFYHPELVEIIKANFENRQFAPKEWKTASSLAHDDKVGYLTSIQAFAEKFRENHPEWFKKYYVVNGRLYEHYHPDLIKEIIEEFKVRHPGDQWLTPSQLKKETGVDRKRINSYANSFLVDHPEWVKERKYKSGKIKRFHPNLVAEIRKWASSQEKIRRKLFNNGINNSWLTTQDMVSKNFAGWDTIKTYAEQFRKSHPNWFQILGDSKKPIEYYHPKLVALIREKFDSREQAPNDWFTISNATKWCGSSGTVKKFINNFKKTNPEYFAFYKVENGNLHEHIHPDLVKKVKSFISEIYSEPPNGWINFSTLFASCNISNRNKARPAIHDFISDCLITNPDWIKVFIKNKVAIELFHPDLLKKVRERFSKN